MDMIKMSTATIISPSRVFSCVRNTAALTDVCKKVLRALLLLFYSWKNSTYIFISLVFSLCY